MAQTHIISALILKYSEIQGQIKFHKESMQTLKVKLENISKTIKIFEPNCDLRAITPKAHRIKLFKNGELKQLVIEYLKNNPHASISSIIEYVVSIKSIESEFHKSVYGGIYTLLNTLIDKGIVDYEAIDGTRCYKIKSRT
ncbi:hypothetical protein CIG11343_0305 [Campylobacter iguaniorum]|uniref:hypothetical protein n=1 Tax=Campylobacter iguaniorum TaxID=1244531 RepID=UPI0007C8BB1A|nr:hypothetical protein [Campylobacter iguaniorum]ANE35393.1 hypothetical protein CIG11343_0305 [Campylobacter iguaniorum]